MIRAALFRGLFLLGLWAVAAGVGTVADLGAGVATAGLATWVSLALLPPRRSRLNGRAVGALLLRLPGQVLVAGADVARRALDPRATIAPGFVAHASRLPPGPRRDAFLTLSSLMPGTLPAGLDAQGRVRVHALDIGQPVAAAMADEEARFARALGGDAHV